MSLTKAKASPTYCSLMEKERKESQMTGQEELGETQDQLNDKSAFLGELHRPLATGPVQEVPLCPGCAGLAAGGGSRSKVACAAGGQSPREPAELCV